MSKKRNKEFRPYDVMVRKQDSHDTESRASGQSIMPKPVGIDWSNPNALVTLAMLGTMMGK